MMRRHLKIVSGMRVDRGLFAVDDCAQVSGCPLPVRQYASLYLDGINFA